jgi:alkylation response protein AidB-like acyl-CoA dehydrogenase
MNPCLDDAYLINGEKASILAADLADAGVVFGRTDVRIA